MARLSGRYYRARGQIRPYSAATARRFSAPRTAASGSLPETLPHELPFAIEFHHGSWFNDTDLSASRSVSGRLGHRGCALFAALAPSYSKFCLCTLAWAPRRQTTEQRQLDPVAAVRPWVPILRDLAHQVQMSTAMSATAFQATHRVIVRHFCCCWEKNSQHGRTNRAEVRDHRSRRPSNERLRVISSAYSRWPPTGRP